MSLEKQIETHAATVKTNSYSMSVGELTTMYKENELDLHPAFQRFFRWTDEQKSRFIESLLLGIPIPPIFVLEKTSSKWDVIDGLQRLSTILELMGELKDEKDQLKKPLILTRTHYLPDLEGRRWASEDKELELPESAKIGIKRARIDVNIVKSASDEDVKYEIFQRLNTGGSNATDQEVRNCVLLMTNRNYFQWIKDLSQYKSFKDCLSLTEKAVEEAFDMELVTRFVSFLTADQAELERIDELGSFLTNVTRAQAKDKKFPKDDIEKVFKNVFDYLSENFSDNSFKRYDKGKKKYVGGLLVSLFEVIAVGLANALRAGRKLPPPASFKTTHKTIWIHLSKQPYSGSGVRASTRIPKTIDYGKRLFQ